MQNYFKNKILNSPRVVGIEVCLRKDGTRYFNVCVLEQKGTEVNLDLQFAALESLAEVVERIDKKNPVVLTFSGKGLIQKKTVTIDVTPHELLLKTLPNANADDLCFEITTTKTNTWVSIIRKPVIVDLLKELEEAGLAVQRLHLGIGSVKALIPILPTGCEVLNFGTAHLTLNNANIESISAIKTANNDSVNIEGTAIAGHLLPSFSSALSEMLGMPEAVHPISLLDQPKSNFYYQRLTKVMGWFLLIGLFVILLINSFVFTNLNKKNNVQSVALSQHQKQLDELTVLRAQYEEKQSFFKNNNMLKSSKVSYYADQIGLSVPEEVKLSKLEIFPSLSDKRKNIGAPLVFNNSTIVVKGQSQKSVFLNGWIKSLQEYAWVSKVNVLPYAEGADGVGEFLLEVVLE